MLSINFKLVKNSPLRYANRGGLLYVFLIFYLDMYDLALFAGYAIYLSHIIVPIYNLFKCLPIFATVLLMTQLAKATGFFNYNLFSHKYPHFKTFALVFICLSYLGLAIFPSYAMMGLGSLMIFTILRVLQGGALGYEIGFAIKYASALLKIQRTNLATYYFILLSGEIGIFISIIFNRFLVSHNSTLLDYEYFWRLQFFLNFILLLVCLWLKSKCNIKFSANGFAAKSFVYTLTTKWRYILLRSVVIFFTALLIMIVIIRVPNILELVFKWPQAEINNVVFATTIFGFIGANSILLVQRFVSPIKIMIFLYCASILENTFFWMNGSFYDSHIYTLWIYSVGFLYGAFLRLTPLVVYSVMDFRPSNRLIGRYLSHLFAYTFLVSFTVLAMDYSHFANQTMHDFVPLAMMIASAALGIVALLLYKPYYLNKVTEISNISQ